MSEFQDAENWEAFMAQGREPEYTPETLRNIPALFDLNDMLIVDEHIAPHADAWEAQVRKAEERAFTHQVIDATLELRDENKALRKRLKAAGDFALWLSPCGQAENPPTYDFIGEKARELLSALTVGEGHNEP